MIKTFKSKSFHEKCSPLIKKKPVLTPLLEVLYDNPKFLESIANPLMNEELMIKTNLSEFKLPEFKDLMENDEILLSEPIFNELCPVSKHSKGNKCNICRLKFGLFTLRKNCRFCGEAFCGDHCDKKRSNPKNQTEFVRICDICERKYLEKIIYQEFVVKKNKRNKAIFEMELQLAKSKEEMMEKQKEIYSLMAQVFFFIIYMQILSFNQFRLFY